MNRSFFAASAALILIANTFALTHAMRNRAGTPDSQVTLTQRELRYYGHSGSDDDTGVTLQMDWTSDRHPLWPTVSGEGEAWLDERKLEHLGFHCGVKAGSPEAERHYQRQRPRAAFVAFAYDDATWGIWLKKHDLALAQQTRGAQTPDPNENTSGLSHLTSIDADLDSSRLRGRHPDRKAVIILPAVIGIFVDLSSKKPVRASGRLEEVPSSIHIPLPFSEGFRRLSGYDADPSKEQPEYRVHLRYGKSFEPWVTGVEFLNNH